MRVLPPLVFSAHLVRASQPNQHRQADSLLHQSFTFGESQGLQRVIKTPEDSDDHHETNFSLLIPRLCSQTPWSFPAPKYSLSLPEKEICADVIPFEGDSITLVYGNAQKDLKLTKTWRDLSLNEYKTTICPALGVLISEDEFASNGISTYIISHDPKISLTNLTESGSSLSASKIELEMVLNDSDRSDKNLSYEALLSKNRPLISGRSEREVLERLLLQPCYDLRFNSTTFVPESLETVKTEYYVSMWGSHARVTEDYVLKNEGGMILGHYNQNIIKDLYGRTLGTFRAGPPALTRHGIRLGLIAEFPPNSTTHEFYDRIGNITTSEVVSISESGQLMVVYPRHPILGQWKASWTLRYLTPLTNLARLNAGRGMVVIPMRTAVSGIWSESRILRIILPPFSKGVVCKSFMPLDGEIEISKERQWLDLWPTRTVVEAKFLDVANYRSATQALLMCDFEHNRTAGALSHLVWFMVPMGIIFGGCKLFDLKKF